LLGPFANCEEKEVLLIYGSIFLEKDRVKCGPLNLMIKFSNLLKYDKNNKEFVFWT